MNDFKMEWDRATKVVLTGSETVVKKASIELCKTIIKDTVVGDPAFWQQPASKNYIPGSLKANWQASFDSPVEDVVDTKDIDGGPTSSKMEEVFNNYKMNKTMYLANNLPYAEVIEYGGHSVQRPEGTVRVSIMNFQNLLEEEVKKSGLL